ncbi:MAG: hypothetical protein DMD50_05780 [Gemmatimonadetes bacterium]|nr:MAG: hypothetical protein DMD50_05780 [Gemmatimonadota bacterium]
MIVVRALGPVDVSVNGAPAPARLLWKKNLALLIYLARSPKRVRTREHLIGLLWGEKPEEKARHSLNEALHVLRLSAGDDGFESDTAQVRIAPGTVDLDTDTLEALAAAGDYARAAALINGDFLEGFSVRGASEFDNWLAAERQQWCRRSVEVLVHRAGQLLTAGNVAAAHDMVEHARELDWRPETAVRTALRTLALAGDRAGALALFDEFVARLQRELGAEPDAETSALAQRVRLERTWRLPKAVREAARASGSRRTPLVGRALELERLTDAWSACRARRRATVAVIEGDAGAGKTRLAEELAARARLDGAVVPAVRAVAADHNEVWSGVFGIARGGLLEAPGVAGAPPDALAQLRGTVPTAAPGRALAEVLRAVADEQPVVVFVDDAHWLDRESMLALGAIIRDLEHSPVTFLLTVAPHPSDPELDDVRARIGRELAGTVLRLGEFGTDEARALGRWALPSYRDEQLDRLARRVLADSAGIPLLVVALLHAVAAGFEPRDAGQPWPRPTETFEQTLPGELPDNVVAAIRVNFRRLSTDAQRVLVATAVLGGRGGRVAGARLGRAAGVAGEALAQALDELEWQSWLAAEPRGYVFVARIVRDVIERDMVTPGQRQRMVEAGGSST